VLEELTVLEEPATGDDPSQDARDETEQL
jgi:hypothetical protein